MVRLSRTLALFLLLISTALPALAQGSPATNLQHGVPWIDPNTASDVSSAPAGAHLTYFGGPVISNVHVVEVLYGSGSYNPQVAGITSPTMGNFFSDLTGPNSRYINLLAQYNTLVAGGTNQTIGNGTFDGLFQIVPSAANNGSTIDDQQNIQPELLAQINAGHLPPPMLDAAGNVNTIYMIYFPPGKTITQGGSSNCGFGPFPFCAYHGTTSNMIGNNHVLYSVHPDLQPGSACARGCGNSTTFGNYTSVTSHELTEAITDADVGIATTFSSPLAWYDMKNGEIGDICNAQQGSYTANDTTYTIQLEFSNAANNCVLPPVVPNFSLSSAPTSLTINQGASATSTIKVTPSGGFTGGVTLSASGLPSGVTATFNPNPATTTSVVTFTASATATAGPATVTIQGISGTLPAQFTNVALTVNAPNPVFSPSALAFGNQNLGTTSPVQIITLSNTGTAPLLISSPIGIGGGFSQTNNCPASLAANTQCTFSVTFTPTTAGQQSNALSVTDNAAGSPQSVALSGNGVPLISPTSLTFSGQIVQTSSPSQPLTVTNYTGSPLVFPSGAISITGNDFLFSTTCTSPLAVNASCAIGVTFVPSVTGNRSATLTLADNLPSSPQSVSLSGTGLPLVPVLSGITPSVVTTGSNDFTLVVTGSGFAGNAVVQVNGSQRPTTFINFTQLNAAIPASDLTGSQPLSITVFNPLPSTALSAVLPLTLTSTPIPLISSLTPPRVEVCNPLPQVVPCNPAVKVIIKGSFFPANPGVQIDSNSLATNFISANQLTVIIPAADLTTSRMAQIQVVSSTGGPGSNQVPLAVFRYGDLTFDNLISVSDLTTLANVVAGNITTFDHAAADVFLNGAIDVQDLITLANYIAGNIHTLPVIPDQTAFLFNAGATVTLSPPMFADQTVGTASDPLPLTLTNGGPTPLSISNIVIPSGDFTQSNNCGNFLAANASCIINVIFSPTLSGQRTNTLTVQDNSINGPHIAVLTGNGIAATPAATLSADSLTFGTQAVGTSSAAQSVTLANTGSTALPIGSISVNMDDFGQSNNCGSSLAPNSTCTIYVTFSPTAIGARIASLVVQSNTGNSLQSLSLSGTGSAGGDTPGGGPITPIPVIDN